MLHLVLLFCLSWTHATSLVSRYQFLNANSLPEGVWTFGVSRSQSTTPGAGSFSQNGSRVSNQEYFSRNVSYSNLIDEVSDPLERDLAEAAFSVYGRADAENAGQVVNDVRVRQKADAYILGRGLTSRSNLFLIFPVVTIQTTFSSRFVQSNSLKQLALQLQKEGQQSKAKEILEKSENALRSRLDENGYRNSYPSELTTLANIYVNYRYQAVDKTKTKIVSDSFVVVPAGKKFDEDDFLPLRVNEEQFSLKQGITGAWSPISSGTLLGNIYYHKRFPFQKAQRIPLNSTSPLSNDRDPNTRIQYGDSWGTSAQVNLLPSESWTLYLGQSFEYKLRDNFSGNDFASSRYDFLEQNSEQRLQLGYLGFSVNTIQSFLAQKFPIPMDLNIQYSFTNGGRNTFQDQTLAMNMMVFYK